MCKAGYCCLAMMRWRKKVVVVLTGCSKVQTWLRFAGVGREKT